MRSLAVLVLVAGCNQAATVDTNSATAWALCELALYSPGAKPTPAPTPSGTCDACNGTGRSGDGLGPCGYCGGDGVLDPGIAPPVIEPPAAAQPVPKWRAPIENNAPTRPPTPPPSAAVEFHDGDYPAAKAEALRRGVPVLTLVSATWCAPCEVIKAAVFGDDEVARSIADRFAICRLDLDETPEIRKYIRELPRWLVSWPAADKTHVFKPSKTPATVLEQLDTILETEAPE